MIKIKKGGVLRITSEKKFKELFKKQGYHIVDQPKEEKENLSELTNKKLREMLEEQGKPTYGTKVELIQRIGE